MSDTDTLDATAPVPPAAGRPTDPLTTRLRLVGEVLVTLGVVLALFVVYEVWVTNWISQSRQGGAAQELIREWAAGPPVATEPVPVGTPMARLTLPSLGPGHSWAVVEGTGGEELRSGPGHYVGSAQPGAVGNFAVAGHRVGRGAPFDDIGELRSCAPLVVETATGWAVYRVLPFADEVAGWATGRGLAPECRGVAPSDPAVPGREIVLPSGVEVIAPVPGRPDLAPVRPLITLTTCHPKFSARQRLIVHGVLDRVVAKVPGGGLPVELTDPTP